MQRQPSRTYKLSCIARKQLKLRSTETTKCLKLPVLILLKSGITNLKYLWVAVSTDTPTKCLQTSQFGRNGRCDKPPPPAAVSDRQTNKRTGKQKDIAIA